MAENPQNKVFKFLSYNVYEEIRIWLSNLCILLLFVHILIDDVNL